MVPESCSSSPRGSLRWARIPRPPGGQHHTPPQSDTGQTSPQRDDKMDFILEAERRFQGSQLGLPWRWSPWPTPLSCHLRPSAGPAGSWVRLERNSCGLLPPPHWTRPEVPRAAGVPALSAPQQGPQRQTPGAIEGHLQIRRPSRHWAALARGPLGQLSSGLPACLFGLEKLLQRRNLGGSETRWGGIFLQGVCVSACVSIFQAGFSSE